MKKRRNAVVFTEIHNYSIIDDITLSKLKSARSRPSLFSLFFLSTETWCRRFSSSSLKSLIDKTDGNGPLCCALEMGPLLALAQKPIRALKLSDGRIRKTSRGLRERETSVGADRRENGVPVCGCDNAVTFKDKHLLHKCVHVQTAGTTKILKFVHPLFHINIESSWRMLYCEHINLSTSVVETGSFAKRTMILIL